jgi:hypothetical protein
MSNFMHPIPLPESLGNRNVWKFAHPIGEFVDGRWTGQIDIARPDLGLQKLRFDDTALAGELLAVAPTGMSSWPARLADAYVRGDDLVAAYEATADWPYASQLYWRAEPTDHDGGVLASLSLLVSIQTSLLDTHPRVCVTSQLPADEVLFLAFDDRGEMQIDDVTVGTHEISPNAKLGCLLLRLPGGGLSYAELMPASDFQRLTVEFDSDSGCRTRWELFAEFLEKGVIRRARLQTALLDRQHDLEAAAVCCRRFHERPLPLTT